MTEHMVGKRAELWEALMESLDGEVHMDCEMLQTLHKTASERCQQIFHVCLQFLRNFLWVGPKDSQGRMERLWSFASHNPHNSINPRIQHYMTQQNVIPSLWPESPVDMKGPPPSICLWKHITDSRKNRLLITVTTGTSAVFIVCILIRLHFLSQAVCIQVISEKHILPRNSVCVCECV